MKTVEKSYSTMSIEKQWESAVKKSKPKKMRNF